MSYWELMRFAAWALFTYLAFYTNSRSRTKFAIGYTWFLFLIGTIGMLILLVSSMAYIFM